jgi:PAS domain S-box-containing protein
MRANRNERERQQAEANIRLRNRELVLLNRIIAVSTSDFIELASILDIACSELATTFDLPQTAAVIFSENKTSSTVVAEYLADKNAEMLPPTISVADNPAFQYLLNYKAPFVVDNAQTDVRLAPLYDLLPNHGAGSLLLLPLSVDDDVIGSLLLISFQSRPFLIQEVNLVWSVANQLAGVVSRAYLDKERRQLSAVIEQTTESVIITDTQGIIVYVNPAFEKTSGYKRDEVFGNSPRILKSGRHADSFYQKLWETIQVGEVWHERLINKKKDGTLYTEDVTITPVRDESGNIVNYVSVRRDVTRELQLEQQYLQAQKMQAIGLLAGGIAHDFNNLLTVINGFAELLNMHLEPAHPQQELVDKILHAGHSAADLTRQLLAFSRKQIIQPETLDLNDIVSKMDKMLGRIIGEHILIETILTPDLWIVKADPTQIEQIILNLAVNARDAMPDGGRLTIETANILLDENYTASHLELQPDQYVLLTISDTGCGMSPEVRARIFEPFFTTKGVDKGTGLGLSVSYFIIVDDHGGEMEVKSKQGKGTNFIIKLPFRI